MDSGGKSHGIDSGTASSTSPGREHGDPSRQNTEGSFVEGNGGDTGKGNDIVWAPRSHLLGPVSPAQRGRNSGGSPAFLPWVGVRGTEARSGAQRRRPQLRDMESEAALVGFSSFRNDSCLGVMPGTHASIKGMVTLSRNSVAVTTS